MIRLHRKGQAAQEKQARRRREERREEKMLTKREASDDDDDGPNAFFLIARPFSLSHSRSLSLCGVSLSLLHEHEQRSHKEALTSDAVGRRSEKERCMAFEKRGLLMKTTRGEEKARGGFVDLSRRKEGENEEDLFALRSISQSVKASEEPVSRSSLLFSLHFPPARSWRRLRKHGLCGGGCGPGAVCAPARTPRG